MTSRVVHVVNTTDAMVRIFNMDTNKSEFFKPVDNEACSIHIPWLYAGHDLLKKNKRGLFCELLEKDKSIYVFEEHGQIHANPQLGVLTPMQPISTAGSNYTLVFMTNGVSLHPPKDPQYGDIIGMVYGSASITE